VYVGSHDGTATLTSPGPTDPPEYPWLYVIPGLLFGGGYIAAASTGMAGLVQAGYLVSSVLCISKGIFLRLSNTMLEVNGFK
jgi:hypothetical protein